MVAKKCKRPPLTLKPQKQEPEMPKLEPQRLKPLELPLPLLKLAQKPMLPLLSLAQMKQKPTPQKQKEESELPKGELLPLSQKLQQLKEPEMPKS